MKQLSFFLFVALAMLACKPQTDNTVPQQLLYGTDVSDAFYIDRLELIDSAFQHYVDCGYMPHAVTMVVHKGRVVQNKAYGWRDIENQIPCQTNDIFRIASQSKAISVIAFMTLFEEGKVQLDEPVNKYIPEYAHLEELDSYDRTTNTYTSHPAKRDITIRHLLTHTSGICYDGYFARIMQQKGVIGHTTLDSVYLTPNVRKMPIVPLKHEPGDDFT